MQPGLAADAATANFADYTSSNALDVQAVVVQDIAVDPPELAGRTETGAMVRVLLIGASGAVDDVQVESSNLPEVYTQIARRDFLGARFTPGLRNGQPVATAMRIEVIFGPQVQPPGAAARLGLLVVTAGRMPQVTKTGGPLLITLFLEFLQLFGRLPTCSRRHIKHLKNLLPNQPGS